MSLSHIKKMQSERGFTIVELLIVIVIIGILAAIVIVAYTGITNRANTSKAQSNAESVQKLAETINANDGNYPNTDALFKSGGTSTNPTSKLPAGITLISATTVSGANVSAAKTAAETDLGTVTGDARYSTIAVYVVGQTGGAIFYLDGNNTVQGPIYYGNASSTSTYTKFSS